MNTSFLLRNEDKIYPGVYLAFSYTLGIMCQKRLCTLPEVVRICRCFRLTELQINSLLNPSVFVVMEQSTAKSEQTYNEGTEYLTVVFKFLRTI
jgi:hypothetical protein